MNNKRGDTRNDHIRNIAIIAHVDHGKTTLVDQMFRQSGVFRDNQTVAERVMDNMDLERERGITISAKNCAIVWNDIKINILDTPGHADFGGEVERALSMVDGAVLLVDASEGPLPQTRFVLKKALDLRLPVIVVINKIDRQDARPSEVLNEVYDLFIDLDADDQQIDFPVLYAIGREGIARTSPESPGNDLKPLFELILDHVPAPVHDSAEPFQMLVSDLDYSDYLGRLAIGRITHGSIRIHDELVCVGIHEKPQPLRVSSLQLYLGAGMKETEAALAGDIVILAGIENVQIGDTICHQMNPRKLKRVVVDEPTIAMMFTINSSPLAGREGKYVQSNKIRERLFKETLRNVAIRVEEAVDSDCLIVKGRGELQMCILIETMRREGFELTAGRPEVILRRQSSEVYEPVEHVLIDCGEAFTGVVSEKLSRRKARLVNLTNRGSGRVRMEFSAPSRALIGYRSEFLTDTKGTGILTAYFTGYERHRGDFPTRMTGSIVSDRSGDSVTYALSGLEPRGTLFIGPGEAVYEGMVIGEHNRESDIDVNPCKTKKLTNMRSSTRDLAVVLTPFTRLTLERAVDFIREDEWVEVTPASIRLRKSILYSTQRHILRYDRNKPKE